MGVLVYGGCGKCRGRASGTLVDFVWVVRVGTRCK